MTPRGGVFAFAIGSKVTRSRDVGKPQAPVSCVTPFILKRFFISYCTFLEKLIKLVVTAMDRGKLVNQSSAPDETTEAA
jgi:hypothetical protein